MQTLYYTGSTLSLIPDSENQPTAYWDSVSSLVTSASLYQIVALSGSTALAYFPIDNTNVYIDYFPPVGVPEVPSVQSIGLANLSITSEPPGYTGLYLKNGTTGEYYISSSIIDFVPAELTLSVYSGSFDYYLLGSGSNYTASLTILNTTSGSSYLDFSVDTGLTGSYILSPSQSTYQVTMSLYYLNDFYVFNADYLVVRYQFDGVTGGTDLDTRTRIVSPVGTKYHGFNCLNTTPAFNAALTVPPNIAQTSYTSTAPYIYWSGDNTGTGVESAYIDLSSSFSPSDTIQVECRAFWFGTKTAGSMSLDIEAYQGGYMSQSGFDFVNVGGTQTANITIPKVITLQTGSGDEIGQLVSNIYYNKAVNALTYTLV